MVGRGKKKTARRRREEEKYAEKIVEVKEDIKAMAKRVKENRRKVMTYFGLLNGSVIIGGAIEYAVKTKWTRPVFGCVCIGTVLLGVSSVYYWNKEKIVKKALNRIF
ncbi:uncharacterized protein LOC111709816 [Eurytemora carolleeae]|uniref:uncharacterized protein LOC111709816 n=1 Tax=Eurytemora carolleeae TaxID=1294199 RepID=UPI000C75C6B0|nr:uncharacterized protein LOC111709816 [Eurytemora carolleeae]|eukprot:XP_023339497.1 uncharacterized protein LOC111709816 [Eurytemora affinis]